MLGILRCRSCRSALRRRACDALQIKYFEALMRQDIGWFDMSSGGDLASRLAEYVAVTDLATVFARRRLALVFFALDGNTLPTTVCCADGWCAPHETGTQSRCTMAWEPKLGSRFTTWYRCTTPFEPCMMLVTITGGHRPDCVVSATPSPRRWAGHILWWPIRRILLQLEADAGHPFVHAAHDVLGVNDAGAGCLLGWRTVSCDVSSATRRTQKTLIFLPFICHT